MKTKTKTKTKIKCGINLELLFLYGIGFLCFLSFLWPAFYTLFNSDYFVFQNSWDEPTYLSYQGALAFWTRPGYQSLLIVRLFHELGISGAIQGLIWDLLVPLLVVLASYKIWVNYSNDRASSLFFALLTGFGSILFNCGNPLIGSISNWSHWIVANESYPSILRTPNPQFSYLILVIAVYIAVHFKKYWPLLLPIPFLYWSVSIPYCFLIIGLFVNHWKPNISLKHFSFFYVIGFLVSGLGLKFLFTILSPLYPGLSAYHGNIENSQWFAVHSVLAAFFVILIIKMNRGEDFRSDFIRKFSVAAFFSILFVSVFHQLTGLVLGPENFQNYGSSPLIVLLYIFVLDVFRRNTNYLGKGTYFLVSIVLVILCFKSQGFYFDKWQYDIYLNNHISHKDLQRLYEKPLQTIVPSFSLSGQIGLIKAKQLLPPFAHQYGSYFVRSQCALNEGMHLKAELVLKEALENENFPEHLKFELKRMLDRYKTNVKEFSNFPKLADSRYCKKSTYDVSDFEVIQLLESPRVQFP